MTETDAGMPARSFNDSAAAPVLVVGAGPTGLLLAGELRRRGVPCLLIDEADAPRGWDRATVIHPRSLEIFESIGILDRLLDVGVHVRGARFHSNGEIVAELNIGSQKSSYGFDIGISEEVTEAVLTEYLEAQGGSVTHSSRLVGLHPGPDGVVAEVEEAGRPHEIAASWVVGCDGYHSSVRELMGIELEGRDFESPWAVFDASTDGWRGEYDLAYAYLDLPTVILTPLPAQRWRVYLRSTSESSDLVAEASEVVRRYDPGTAFTDVENPMRFRCHSRVASHFRSGRVLLAGDAAHTCSPTEGHGMNTGLQDAFNLAWKLALVCQGVAADALLDSYEAERRPVAVRVAESGDASEAMQSLVSVEERAARDAALRSTFADPGSAHHEVVAHAELDRSYGDCGLVRGDTNELLPPGVRLPNTAPVGSAEGGVALLHQLANGPNHTILVLGGPQTGAQQVLALKRDVEAMVAGSRVVDAVLGFSAREASAGIGHMDASVAEELGVDGLTVLGIRPDRYVGFRHDGGDPAAVDHYLRGLLG